MKISDFFYFQRSDRRVIFFLLSLIVGGIALTLLLDKNVALKNSYTNDSTNYKADKRMYYDRDGNRTYRYERGSDRRQGSSYIYNNVEKRQTRLFAFDPNTADSTQLLQLGLAAWQVRNIYHYRAKGGVFRTPDDFAKVYGMTKKQFSELKPYIHISDDYQPAATLVRGGESYNRYNPYDPQDRDTLLHPIKIQPNEKIVLNTADTTTLKKVPGIGSGWARTIASYGNYLGGYVAVEQLLDIDGFPEELLHYFTIKDPSPKKLKINELSLNQLKRHPYINFYQARAITDYRRLNGKLQSLDQLKLLKEFPEEAIKRLEPYIEY